MKLWKKKQEPMVTFFTPDLPGGTLEVPDSQVVLTSFVLSELSTLQKTVVDLNARVMELEGDEYE